MLMVTFAAIHTSSNSFTYALFHLSAEPQYISSLHEEVEQLIKEDGWDRVAMTKLWKLDSFMKESQRMNGIFNHGTYLPEGAIVSANSAATHDAHFPTEDRFDGFRLAKLRDESAAESIKHQMVNTSSHYLSSGHGRRACPGRFFAVNELKAMMAYLLMNYDLKAEV